MYVDISPAERQILIQLLESQVRELHPAIRRSRVYTVTDELKHDLEDVERLLEKVRNVNSQEADREVTA